MRDNRWPGPVNLELPEAPEGFWEREAMFPGIGEVQASVGPEAFLWVLDPTPSAADLGDLGELTLEARLGCAPTSVGLATFMVVAVADPDGGPVPLAAWEHFVDLFDDTQTEPLLALAEQAVWHVIVVGPGPAVVGLFEVENVFGFDRVLAGLKERFDEMAEDFGAAVAEVQQKFRLDELFEMAEDASVEGQTSEEILDGVLAQLRQYIAGESREGVEAVGKLMNENGGMQLMSFAHQRYTELYGDEGQPRLVDMWWSGIGAWQG